MSDSRDPKDCSLPGSSVHGTSQARILEWVAFPSPGDLSNLGNEPGSPALKVNSLPTEPSGSDRDLMNVIAFKKYPQNSPSRLLSIDKLMEARNVSLFRQL